VTELEKLRRRLARVEQELESCRPVAIAGQRGTMRQARASRRWDYLAREKSELRTRIEELTARETT
jgi:hypothetical protein